MKVFNTVDLFCGAGGASTGMEDALHCLKLRHKGLAINHWSVAVDTMQRNHPDINTLQMKIEDAVPADLVPGGVVDLLWASPSCTHHSRAKGGKPRSNQLRAQPELVLTWLDQLFVRRVIIENVPEFVEWGPLNKDGKPIKRLKGSCFRSWVASIEARNYTVEWRIVNCADYGDATSRRRFFLKAVRKGCGKIRWPEPTHAENPQPDLFGHELKKWRGARECLDLSDLGKSIFNREHPLSRNTLLRVAVGMKKYNGMDFLMDMLGSGGGDESRVHLLTKPIPTQHSGGNRCAVVRPFIVKLKRNCGAEDIDSPLSTATTKESHALCQPFIVKLNNHADAENVEKPLTSVLAGGQHHALCQPLIIDHFKNGEAQSVDAPIGAQTTHDRYSVVQPFIMDYFGLKHDHEHHVKGVDKPIPTRTTEMHHYLCTPLVLGQHGGAECRPIDKPCPTIATAGAIRVATPIIYNEAVGLPQLPDGRFIDILMRMLKPLRDRILCAVPGNHEGRSGKDADDCPIYDIMCKLDLEDFYRENIAFVKIGIGNPKGDGERNPTYALAIMHGAGGGIPPGNRESASCLHAEQRRGQHHQSGSQSAQ